jgi:predicted phage-related endonuclease
VYASKVADIEMEETLPMRRGRRWEAVIADEYSEQTGRQVADLGGYLIQRHPDVPWLGASLDRVTSISQSVPNPGERAPLEIKMALGSPAAWKDGPPLGFLVQVQIEVACYGASWGALAGLVGPGPLDVTDHPRNDSFLAAALPKLEEFWFRVQRRQPPPADALPGTTAAIKKLWADEDGTTVALDMETQAMVLELELARDAAAKNEKRTQGIENELRRRLGSASFGALADGSFLTARETHRSGYTVEPTTYRALRRWWPRLKRR